MPKPVSHFSRIRQSGDRTITGTLCNRMVRAGDINCSEVIGEVTCKLCLRELDFRLKHTERPNCYSRVRASMMVRP